VLDQKIFLITPFSNTFNLCSSVNMEGQVSHPYAASGVIIVLPPKGHPNNILFDDRNKFPVQKSNTSNCNSTFSVFSVFYAQTVRHVLKTIAVFSVRLRQMHYVFQETSISVIIQHITSITSQHASHIVNTWSLHIRKEIFKNTLRTYFSWIKILVFCYPIINLCIPYRETCSA